MILVQILILFGVFVYASQLTPQEKPYDKENKVTEKDKADVEHVNPDKNHIFHANLTKLRQSNTKEKIFNATSSNETIKNQTLNHNVTSSRPVISSNVSLQTQTIKEKTDELASGAITRGILVFVAFSFLFILYVGIKTCRRKRQDKRNTIIKKYGIRARRSDIEMEPLPLSDDEEDETVFDLTASRGST